MKRIAMLTCLEATEICSGAACFNALNQRKAHFADYAEVDVEVVAFFHCNGCRANYDEDESYREKIERVISLRPDAVHVGKCVMLNGDVCPIIAKIIETLEDAGLTVVLGTH